MGWVEAVILGLVQGVTEFLPVSSSGHLVIAQHLFGLREPMLLFDVVLHVGTVTAVVWYYRRSLWEIITDTVAGAGELTRRRPWGEVAAARPGLAMAVLLVVGSVPTAAIGLAFEDAVESLFGAVGWVGAALLVTAALLAVSGLASKRDGRVTVAIALAVGVAQGIAIVPGISRSGATIAVALLLGVERELAARFSFLLSVPAILGALALQLATGAERGASVAQLGVGFAVAAVAGYVCLALLVRVVRVDRLHWFAPYCVLAAVVALALAVG